jgi:hypothetical protein
VADVAFDQAAIAADAVALAELHGGTGHESVRIDWLRRRLAEAPGSRHVDGAGNLTRRKAGNERVPRTGKDCIESLRDGRKCGSSAIAGT